MIWACCATGGNEELVAIELNCKPKIFRVKYEPSYPKAKAAETGILHQNIVHKL